MLKTINQTVISLVFFILFFISIVGAQQIGDEKEKATVSFGKVELADLQKKVYTIDSAAEAVIIADIGSSRIEGNNKGWFSLIHTHYRRVHILKKSAYDLADVTVHLYVDHGGQERLTKIKANTYNLEGGKIVKSSLAARDVFTDKEDQHHIVKRFTLPHVKEGAIIEYEYTTSSDFLFNFQPWVFQGTVPRLWSEYTVEIPQFLDYVFLSYGYNPLYIKADHAQDKDFRISDGGVSTKTDWFSFRSTVKTTRYVMKDVKALKEEPFTSTLANHISRIEFQLAGYKEPLAYKRILGNWPSACQKLLSLDDFGADLNSDNAWLSDEIKLANATDTALLAQATAVYYYLRNQYKCNDNYGIYLSKPGLKNVVKAKGGKVADVNLLLTAMLNYLKIDAHPVILSTAGHGRAHPFYPLMSQYNYVVVKASINNQMYLLDASQPTLPFGKLMPYCYNGTARVIARRGEPLLLSADSLTEASQILITLQPNDAGEIAGNFRKRPGDYESIRLRTKVQKDGITGLKKELEKKIGTTMTIDSLQLINADSLNIKPELVYHYTLKNSDDQLILINPLQAETTKTNPFTSAERHYPIEMPYGYDEVIQMSLTVPKGYVVDEMPKASIISLDEERNCFYQYRIQEHDGIVEVLSRFVVKKANYKAAEYTALRSFFELVVKKQNESIVLKKI